MQSQTSDKTTCVDGEEAEFKSPEVREAKSLLTASKSFTAGLRLSKMSGGSSAFLFYLLSVSLFVPTKPVPDVVNIRIG